MSIGINTDWLEDWEDDYKKLKNKQMDITDEQLENMHIADLQLLIECMNNNKQIENKEFENFQVLLLKDINITEVNKED